MFWVIDFQSVGEGYSQTIPIYVVLFASHDRRYQALKLVVFSNRVESSFKITFNSPPGVLSKFAIRESSFIAFALNSLADKFGTDIRLFKSRPIKAWCGFSWTLQKVKNKFKIFWSSNLKTTLGLSSLSSVRELLAFDEVEPLVLKQDENILKADFKC